MELKEVEGLHLNSIYICPPSQEKLMERIDERSVKQKLTFMENLEKSKEEKLKVKREHNESYFASYEERKARKEINTQPEIADLPTVIPSLERELDLHLGRSSGSAFKSSLAIATIPPESGITNQWTFPSAREALYKKYAQLPGFFTASLVNEDLNATFDAISDFIRKSYSTN